MKAQMCGALLKRGDLVGLILIREPCETDIEIVLTTSESAINKLCEEVSHGGDRLGRPHPRTKPTQAISERTGGSL